VFLGNNAVINIFVGNLDFATTEEQLRTLFAAYGAVDRVAMVTDRDTGRARGFAFVEMSNPEEAQQAIRSLDGTLFNQRTLRVNEARPKAENNRQKDSFRGRDHRRHSL
jgi:cold-inducible RNA-binding protein